MTIEMRKSYSLSEEFMSNIFEDINQTPLKLKNEKEEVYKK
jgi:hypothetical protein